MGKDVRVCKEKFIGDIGYKTFKDSFSTHESRFSLAHIFEKDNIFYVVDLIDDVSIQESIKIYKDSDVGRVISSKYFD